MLQIIKTLIGITDNSKDAILTVLISQCQDFVRNYCHISDISELDGIVQQMVVYRYNRLGTEGSSHSSVNGVSFTYTDYPDSIIAVLNSHRRIRVV